MDSSVSTKQFEVIVLGGGAAGIFAAIQAKKIFTTASVLVLEKSGVLLSKVRISGGGRCNVTHSCFMPSLLIQNYPRGSKELLSCFHRFQPQDTVNFFKEKGVSLKTEEDGRMFPVTDSSETIISALLTEAKQLGVEICTRTNITHLEHEEDFKLYTPTTTFQCKALILATGNHPEGHRFAASLGHNICKPLPSLFTFNVPTSPLKELSGISLKEVTLSLQDTRFAFTGPIVLTHFGFSGPCVLKLSAFAAPYFFEKNYRVPLLVNWLSNKKIPEIISLLQAAKQTFPQKLLSSQYIFALPKNLWKQLIAPFDKKMVDLSKKELHLIAEKLSQDLYLVEGKTTNKEEFVTCGGVDLQEVDFNFMESKKCPSLFFAGEILHIDGITGGFNFQNAWTTGFIAGRSTLRKHLEPHTNQPLV